MRLQWGKLYRLFGIAALLGDSLIFLWYIVTASQNGWRVVAAFNRYEEGPLELALALASFPAILWIAVRELQADEKP